MFHFQLVLDFVTPEINTHARNTDIWVSCGEIDGGGYMKSIYTGSYFSYDSIQNTIKTTNDANTIIQFNTWRSVPGYTLIMVQSLAGNTMLAYDGDQLNVINLDIQDFWAHWNKQPLDPVSNDGKTILKAVDDCKTPFALQNQGSQLYLSFGNAYPYDGFIIPHYGSINTVLFLIFFFVY